MMTPPDWCSKAVAHRAAPPSATDGIDADIARGMGATSVNPLQAASAVGRGPNPLMIGEFAHPNIGNLIRSADKQGAKTSDGQ